MFNYPWPASLMSFELTDYIQFSLSPRKYFCHISILVILNSPCKPTQIYPPSQNTGCRIATAVPMVPTEEDGFIPATSGARFQDHWFDGWKACWMILSSEVPQFSLLRQKKWYQLDWMVFPHPCHSSSALSITVITVNHLNLHSTKMAKMAVWD